MPNIDASPSDSSSWLLSTSVVSKARASLAVVPQAGFAKLHFHGPAPAVEVGG